jgi:hypothetical protein
MAFTDGFCQRYKCNNENKAGWKDSSGFFCQEMVESVLGLEL